MTSEYHLEKLTSFLNKIDNSCASSFLYPFSFSFIFYFSSFDSFLPCSVFGSFASFGFSSFTCVPSSVAIVEKSSISNYLLSRPDRVLSFSIPSRFIAILALLSIG
jgi:hypothetical protein